MASSFDTASHTRVQPQRAPRPAAGGESGLSIKTLVATAVASGAAMLIVSQVWRPGTLLFAAVTPVLFSVLDQLLRKPKETIVAAVPAAVRPARQVPDFDPLDPEASERPTQVVRPGEETGAAGVTHVRDTAVAPDGRPRATPASAGRPGAPRPAVPAAAGAAARRADAGPAETVRATPATRRRRLRIALITGLLGFAIAATAVTVPELVSGRAASGGGNATTLFGGTADERDRERDSRRDPTTTTGATTRTVTTTQRTPAAENGAVTPTPTPTRSAPVTGEGAAPQESEPVPPEAVEPTTPSTTPTTPAPTGPGAAPAP